MNLSNCQWFSSSLTWFWCTTNQCPQSFMIVALKKSIGFVKHRLVVPSNDIWNVLRFAKLYVLQNMVWKFQYCFLCSNNQAAEYKKLYVKKDVEQSQEKSPKNASEDIQEELFARGINSECVICLDSKVEFDRMTAFCMLITCLQRCTLSQVRLLLWLYIYNP